MAALTAPVTPSENESDAEEMCSTDRPALRPTMWLRDPETGQLRRVEPGERVWALHPVTGELVRVRTWKDVRDLERQARRAGVSWDQLIVVTDAGASTADVRASLAGHGPWPAIATDENSARGHLRLPVFGAPEPVDPVEWVQELAGDQKRLRQLGAGHVAHTLFGAKTRRDIVAGVGAAMLNRGPSGRLGNRHGAVAIAAAAADLLSADQIADLLSWPAPDDEFSARSAPHLRTVLSLLPSSRRLRFIEMIIVRSLNRYDDDYYYYFGDDTLTRPAHRPAPMDAVAQYLDAVRQRLLEAGGESLVAISHGAVGPTTTNSIEDQLELAALLARLHTSDVGPLPRFVEDIGTNPERLLQRTFPALERPWVWDSRLIEALGDEVPGLPGSRILLPSDQTVLAEWGVRMGNCIGGYAHSIDAGGVVGAVEIDGQIEVNFQLKPYGFPLMVGEVAARFNQYDPDLVDPVVDHLLDVKRVLPLDLVPATRLPAQVPGPGECALLGEELWRWTAADVFDSAMDERFNSRCRRSTGRRRHHQRRRADERQTAGRQAEQHQADRHQAGPTPTLGLMRRIAADPHMSLIAAEVVRLMEFDNRVALRFCFSPDRSIPDVLAIAAEVSPADAWLVPGAGPLLAELLAEFDDLTPEELGRRWDQIAPFGHAPRVDDAVRAVLVAILDGGPGELLVRELDRHGESLATAVLSYDPNPDPNADPRLQTSARVKFYRAWHRLGMGPRTQRRRSER